MTASNSVLLSDHVKLDPGESNLGVFRFYCSRWFSRNRLSRSFVLLKGGLAGYEHCTS
jgi:hypothetical protein